MPISTIKGYEGYHALTVACSMIGDLSIVQTILDKLSTCPLGHVDRQDGNGLTALGAAILADRADIATHLTKVSCLVLSRSVVITYVCAVWGKRRRSLCL